MPRIDENDKTACTFYVSNILCKRIVVVVAEEILSYCFICFCYSDDTVALPYILLC